MSETNAIVKGKIIRFFPNFDEKAKSFYKVKLKDGREGILPVTETLTNIENSYTGLAQDFLGKEFIFKIISKEPLTLSQTEAVAQEINNMNVGDIITVKVLDIDGGDGVVLEKDGIPMYLPKSEACHLDNPLLTKMFESGQIVKVQIIDMSNGRITVTHKPFTKITREYIETNYAQNTYTIGQVTYIIKNAGVETFFVNIEPGVDIACRLNNFTKEQRKRLLSKIQIDTEVIIKVSGLNKDTTRISGMIIDIV